MKSFMVRGRVYLGMRRTRSHAMSKSKGLCLCLQAVLECLNQSTTNNPFKGGDKIMGRITLLVPSRNADQDSVLSRFMGMTQVCSRYGGVTK